MALEAVIVVVGAIATLIGLAELAARLPIRRRPPAAPPPPRSRTTPGQLLRIERIVDRAGESGVAAHTLLRPLLVEIAEARLRRRGLRLEEDAAAALLGADAWELVRPGRPAPHDRDEGVTRRELEHVLDRLEAL
jgi:urease gamma subunit